MGILWENQHLTLNSIFSVKNKISLKLIASLERAGKNISKYMCHFFSKSTHTIISELQKTRFNKKMLRARGVSKVWWTPSYTGRRHRGVGYTYTRAPTHTHTHTYTHTLTRTRTHICVYDTVVIYVQIYQNLRNHNVLLKIFFEHTFGARFFSLFVVYIREIRGWTGSIEWYTFSRTTSYFLRKWQKKPFSLNLSH